MADVNKVIKIAEAEVGYLEKKNNSQLDNKTGNAGSNNYTKYWKELAPGMNGQAWCNAFVNWVFVKAYGEKVAKELLCTSAAWSYYTPTSAGYFKNKKQYHTKNPKVGDIIYFKNSTRICHVGLVYKVDSSKVYTIEGNTSSGPDVVANGGGVFKKSYALNNSRIDGYGRPNYGPEETTVSPFIFDAAFYNNYYKDLNSAFHADEAKLKEHFIKYGMKEGRQAHIIFDPKYYKANNADLAKAFGDDWTKYYEHFLKYGIKEFRKSSEIFDAKSYRKNNADLDRAFGDDCTKYIEHFLKYAINKETRKASELFDIRVYKKHADLLKAFGDNSYKYYEHWYRYGKKENRKWL